MKNHWLDIMRKKLMWSKIHEKALDIWDNDGTFGDFFDVLNTEEVAFLMDCRIKDFSGDVDDFSFGMEIIHE